MGARRTSLGPVGDLAAAIGTFDESHGGTRGSFCLPDRRSNRSVRSAACLKTAGLRHGANTGRCTRRGQKNKLVKWPFSTPSRARGGKKNGTHVHVRKRRAGAGPRVCQLGPRAIGASLHDRAAHRFLSGFVRRAGHGTVRARTLGDDGLALIALAEQSRYSVDRSADTEALSMRSNLAKAALAAIAISGSFMALEGDASACGGCFIPTENPTVVTDHRMILSVSKDQSTLYDQIKYSGSPSSFAWVLPISGTVEVGLSADIVFQALDGMTQTQISPPPQNCPPPPDCGNRNAGVAAPSAAGGAEDTGGVTVTKREVVGPYETVQLKATDPGALATWLAKNGFNVPADVQPVVDQYVNEKFDFLALKLVPGKTVQDMRPVRVTTKGASSVLPLRMVAAGTGSTVGIGALGRRRGPLRDAELPLVRRSPRATSRGTGRRTSRTTPRSARRRRPPAAARRGRSRARSSSTRRTSRTP